MEYPDPDPDRLQPRGRARLPGAGAHASRQVLRAAAGAAAVQAIADGGGLRPVFSDRAVLPRRGVARRPFARRILSARLRNELRDAGGRVRDDRTGDRRRVRGIRRGPRGHAGAVPANPVRHGDAGIRLRQAGPAQSAADRGRDRAICRLGVRAVRADRRVGRDRARGAGAGCRLATAQLLRQAERMGARRGPGRTWATSFTTRTDRRGRSRATWSRIAPRRSVPRAV